MRAFPLLIIAILLSVTSVSGASPKMRPYSGIGVLRISAASVSAEHIPLYEEPGLERSGFLEPSSARELTGWLFGSNDELSLLVTAKKGQWLRIERDDAGREAWILPERRWNFSTWDQYLKGKEISFLKTAPKRFLQITLNPGTASGSPVTTRHSMKVILLQGDWAYVLFERTNGGWMRWRDTDGRLLIVVHSSENTQSR